MTWLDLHGEIAEMFAEATEPDELLLAGAAEATRTRKAASVEARRAMLAAIGLCACKKPLAVLGGRRATRCRGCLDKQRENSRSWKEAHRQPPMGRFRVLLPRPCGCAPIGRHRAECGIVGPQRELWFSRIYKPVAKLPPVLKPPRTRRDLPHGTRSRYQKRGCRCEACRAANCAYQIELHRRRAA